MKLSTAQIGKCGELLVQYLLLKNGIESSQMTTDTGIDLVAFSQRRRKAFTIQVKTCEVAKANSGSEKHLVNWWVPVDNQAEYLALAYLEKEMVWLFTDAAFREVAQQRNQRKFQFFMSTTPNRKRKDQKLIQMRDFDEFLVQNQIQAL